MKSTHTVSPVCILGRPTVIAVWWTGSLHLLHYSLNKAPTKGSGRIVFVFVILVAVTCGCLVCFRA